MVKQMLLLVLGLVCTIIFCSCNLYGRKTPSIKAEIKVEKWFSEIVEILEEKDETALRDMFSKEALEKMKDFDGIVGELFDYFQGEVLSYTNESWGYEEASVTEHRKSIAGQIGDIKTTEGGWRLGVMFCPEDTDVAENEGILALYIMKEENATSDDGYMGDYGGLAGSDALNSRRGIFIEQHNVDEETRVYKELINNLFIVMQEHNVESILGVFSQQIKNDVNNLDKQAEELCEYFKGGVQRYTINADGESRVGRVSLDIYNHLGVYRMALISTLPDETDNPECIGVTSIYMLKATDDMDLSKEYWGDGKDTPGIHIGVKN